MFREITVFRRTAVIGNIKICVFWIYLGKEKGLVEFEFRSVGP
jgi:hypothetical protein